MEIERTQTQWKNQRKKHDDEKKRVKKNEKREPEPNKIQGRKGMGRKKKRGDGILETTTDHVGGRGLYQRAAPEICCSFFK